MLWTTNKGLRARLEDLEVTVLKLQRQLAELSALPQEWQNERDVLRKSTERLRSQLRRRQDLEAGPEPDGAQKEPEPPLRGFAGKLSRVKRR